jgi:ribosomal protein L29
MATKTVKLEIPFQKLISIIDQLDHDEKLVLKKKLEKQKVTTWQERFGKAMQQLGKKNIRFSEKEVAEDVKKAIAEVRTGAKN